MNMQDMTGSIVKIDVATKEMSLVKSMENIGSIDGITKLGNHYLASNASTRELLAFTEDTVEVLGVFEGGMADISVNQQTGEVYLPYLETGEVRSYSFDSILLGGLKEQTSSTGSGYEDLKGSVINYGYDNFDDFDLTIYNNKIKWIGQVGLYKGIAQEVVPQISKVAEGVYFMSWPTSESEGDNVIHNYHIMKANAHLYLQNDVYMIHGDVYSINESTTRFPHGALTPANEVIPMVMQNAARMGLAMDANALSFDRFPETTIAIEELEDKALEYESAEGLIHIEVNDEITNVSVDNRPAGSYQPFVSKIDENIYLISWNGEHGGNHIAVNINTMKVYDHINESGERREAIYDVTYFGERK